MKHRHYRIVVNYNPEEEKYEGRVPELPECTVQGETWEEVIELLDKSTEEKIESLKHPPTPIDENEWDGDFKIEMSKSLYRELAFLAKNDEVEPETLAKELIAEGLGRRYGGHRYYRRKNRNKSGNQRKRGRRKGNMSREKYHNIMENKSSFLDYVRKLDK
ncbi:MAG: hypothetical protein ACQES9_00170 [Myxococcota bacterium]